MDPFDAPLDSSLPDGSGSVAGVTKEVIAQLVQDALTQALAPMKEALETIKGQSTVAAQKAEQAYEAATGVVLGDPGDDATCRASRPDDPGRFAGVALDRCRES